MSKKLLYVGIVVAVAIAAYLIYLSLNNGERYIPLAENREQSSNQENQIPVESGTVRREGDNYIYANSEFGFELTFPKTWEGLNPREEKGSTFVKTVYFQVPAVYCSGTPDQKTGTCYVYPIAMTVFTKAQWDIVNQGALKPTYIAEKGEYVFAYGAWQDPAPGMESINFQIPSIASSFRFN